MKILVMPALAINGGVPVRTRPFAPWPYFAKDEVDAVVSVLRSGKVNYWTGEEGRLFEKEFAEYIGTNHAIAVANGTVACELALYVLGVGPGDEVVVTSRTFIASASCIVMRGATPIVADVDPVSQNMTAETIRAVLSPRTKAIIAVHLAGWPCDMEPILELAEEHGLKIIEDCAQAHGASYKGQPIGSFGDMAAFSFCQDKIMTTGGEGGMLVTNDKGLWERAWAFKDHGKSYDAAHSCQHSPGFRWLHESFGTNWRMTEMQSALGRIQLGKLNEWVRARRDNARILTTRFEQLPGLRVTLPPQEIEHAYYKYYVFIRPEVLRPGWDRDRVMTAVNAEGVPCSSGICPEIYLEKAFANEGLQPPVPLAVAPSLGNASLMFLVHPTLNERDMEDAACAVEKVLAVATSVQG